MPSVRPSRSWADVAWIAMWLVVSALWCVSASTRLSATFDEPTYVATGLERWRSGGTDALMRLGTMPLPVDVMTLPLFIAEKARGRPFEIAADARGLVVGLADLPVVLPFARAAMLPFWALLVVAVWRCARRLGGPAAARLAVGLVAVEPTLLAHASLATTDLALTACVVAFGAAFAAGREGPWRARVALPALWFGLALLSKASALVFCPAILLAVELSRAPAPNRRRNVRRDAVQILALGVGLAFAYCGSGWHREGSFVTWGAQRPGGVVSSALRAIAAVPIFANAGEAIVRQIAHNVRGHGVYLLGRTDPRALWYYFPLALTMKISGALVAALAWLAVRSRGPQALDARSWPMLAAFMIIAASVTFRVQTGVRLILPVFPLLIVGVSVGLADAWRSSHRMDKRLAAVVAMTCLIWTSAETTRLWPDAIRFTNELWGGTRRGYLRVSDSNYDWGQGLLELEAWQRRTGAAPLDLWYWGTDPRARSAQWRMRPLQDLPLRSVADVQRELAGRYLAVSTTILYGSVLADPRDESPDPRVTAMSVLRATLRAKEPADRTATFLIYDFTDAPVRTATAHQVSSAAATHPQ